MDYVKFEKIDLKRHAELDEKWVQARIAEDPMILGLGELVMRDKERIQPRAGRLDLLLQESDGNRRYEVEIQLGATDESHIIRTIEYWDIEKKRFPQYEHTAVIIAEDITSRFLNVINLFNGMIPLIAIQMNALKLGDQVGLVFTTVLDHMPLGLVDEDEEIAESTDRNYWIQKSSIQMVTLADQILRLAQEHDSKLELKYNKFYIGIAKSGHPLNFAIFRPKRGFIRFEPRLPFTKEMQEELERKGLDVMDYDRRWNRFRIRIEPRDFEQHKETLEEIIKVAYLNEIAD